MLPLYTLVRLLHVRNYSSCFDLETFVRIFYQLIAYISGDPVLAIQSTYVIVSVVATSLVRFVRSLSLKS